MTLRVLLAFVFFFSLQAQAGICTREYAPVCGQLPDRSQTFSNLCMMKDARATWQSNGECPPSSTNKNTNAKSKHITLTVAGHDAACIGAAPMRCLQVKEGKGKKWLNFYNPIEGFTFTPGVEQVLLVRATPIEHPPMDASDTRFELVRVVSRKPVQ